MTQDELARFSGVLARRASNGVGLGQICLRRARGSS